MGILLTCLALDDVTTCTVRSSPKSIYISKKECMAEMEDFSIFAATKFNLITRPYCFPLNLNNT